MPISKITSNAFSTTANTNIDNGTLFVDPVNNRVGVNTTTGQATLTIQSSGANGLQVLPDATNTGVSGRIFLTSSTASGAVYYSNTLGWVFHTGSTVNNSTGTQRLFITPEGYVKKPYQPAFSALKNGTAVESSFTTAARVTSWQNPLLNNGSNFDNSTGRFTAPVAGNYMFTFNSMHSGTTVGDVQFRWYKNGSLYVGSNHTAQGGSWLETTVVCVMYLAVGDYAEPWAYSGGAGSSGAALVYADTYSHVNGFFIG